MEGRGVRDHETLAVAATESYRAQPSQHGRDWRGISNTPNIIQHNPRRVVATNNDPARPHSPDYHQPDPLRPIYPRVARKQRPINQSSCQDSRTAARSSIPPEHPAFKRRRASFSHLHNQPVNRKRSYRQQTPYILRISSSISRYSSLAVPNRTARRTM